MSVQDGGALSDMAVRIYAEYVVTGKSPAWTEPAQRMARELLALRATHAALEERAEVWKAQAAHWEAAVKEGADLAWDAAMQDNAMEFERDRAEAAVAKLAEVEAREARLRRELEYIQPALSVLATLLKQVGLHMGEQKALDMAASVNAALKVKS